MKKELLKTYINKLTKQTITLEQITISAERYFDKSSLSFVTGKV